MIRAVSYGGGVQSTALLVLAAQRRIVFPLFIMANVGDDSEAPETLAYVRDHARPYAERHGIELVEVQKRLRDGTPDTVLRDMTNPDTVSLGIPYRSKPQGPPMSRSCTHSFKMVVIGRELKRRGATGGRACNAHARAPRCLQHQPPKAARPCRFHPVPDCTACRPANLATVGIGFSLDEIHRANRQPQPWERLVYPLVGVGEETGLKLTRLDCQRLIADAGLPIPPKSACWFCPFHTLAAWSDMRRTKPDRFEAAAELEAQLRARSIAAGNGPVFISSAGIPLRDAIDDGQAALFEAEDAGCDTGGCWL